MLTDELKALIERLDGYLDSPSQIYLRDKMLAALTSAPSASPAQAGVPPFTFHWLVELRPAFAGHPHFEVTYYAGWMEHPAEAAKTHDPLAAVRFARKEEAERVAKKLGHTLSCVWQAIEHGFAPCVDSGSGKGDGEVMLNGLTEQETSATASVAGFASPASSSPSATSAEVERDDDGELLIDWSPGKGRMVTLSLRDDGRLSYAITWDGEQTHGTAQMPAGSVPPAGGEADEPWEPIPESHLADMEKWIVNEGLRRAVFFPADAQHFCNITMHMIREVRATRRAPSASPATMKTKPRWPKAAAYIHQRAMRDDSLGWEKEAGILLNIPLYTKDQVKALLAAPASPATTKTDDTALLNFLREETLDLRCFNVPTGGDDYEVRWRVIQHYQAAPHERDVGEGFTDDPRDAIFDAMRALAAPASPAAQTEQKEKLEPNGPEFTDWGRAALLWVLWHHQGGSSKVGQPIRFALGMGEHDRLSDAQVEQAKRWEALAAGEQKEKGQ